MKVLADRRFDRSTGHYSSRAALLIGCTKYKAQGLSNKGVGSLTGVSAATVKRILDGDTSHTGTVEPPVDPTAVQSLKRLWSHYRAWKPTCFKDILDAEGNIL